MPRPPLVGTRCRALDERCKRPSVRLLRPELLLFYLSDLPLLCCPVCLPQGRICSGWVHRGEGCHPQAEGGGVRRSGHVPVPSGHLRFYVHHVLFVLSLLFGVGFKMKRLVGGWCCFKTLVKCLFMGTVIIRSADHLEPPSKPRKTRIFWLKHLNKHVFLSCWDQISSLYNIILNPFKWAFQGQSCTWMSSVVKRFRVSRWTFCSSVDGTPRSQEPPQKQQEDHKIVVVALWKHKVEKWESKCE